MTLVLEESEDISLELLSPILATVKKANEVNHQVNVSYLILICLVLLISIIS